MTASVLLLACTQAAAHDSPTHHDSVRFGSLAQSDERFDDGGTRRLGTRSGRSLGAHSDGLGRLGQGTGTRRFGSDGGGLGSMRGGSIEGGRDHGLGVYRGDGLGAWSGSSIGATEAPPPRRGGVIRFGR
ncbi:MAG TPA: hypothetical protein VEC57_16615 [Candidatus Limnocylindrales bacterium]|nr:hypothetical protein [Candidatus Limnocylindrales bacterium]